MAPITAFRIKSEFRKADQIIRDIDDLDVVPIVLKRKPVGLLYVQRAHPSPPKWLKFFEGQRELEELGLMSSSVSAVYLVTTKSRQFAVTFGFGRYLLEEGVIEPRFGLKATLNAVLPEKLRSIDHKRLDAVPRLTREQLGKSAGMDQFGLNVERDMLRAIAGTPKDSQLGTVMAGADQLVFTRKVTLADLGEALDEYAALSERTDYRSAFAWVDNIQEISDAVLKGRLDDSLVQKVRKGDDASAWLSLPEIVDWSDVGEFSYSPEPRNASYPDLVIEDYRGGFKRLGDITIERLRSDRVRLMDAQGEGVRAQWPVYRCLCADIRVGESHFVLNEGKWYRIATDFLAQIDEVVSGLRPTAAPLPASAAQNEPDYLKRVWQRSKGDYSLLDRKTISLPGRSAVEACDLFWKERAFVHVKRYGASSQLSHLFSQGTVAATLFHSEQTFRERVHELLQAEHRWGRPSDPIQPKDFEVAFAVMAGKRSRTQLPFFSKVNLRNSVNQLSALGFRVSLTFIPS